MTFARLNMLEVPQENNYDGLLHINTTDAMEPKCVRSLNGYRSTMELIRLVPDKEVSEFTIFSKL